MIWASNWPLNRPILPTAEWSRKWGVGGDLFQNRLLHLKIRNIKIEVLVQGICESRTFVLIFVTELLNPNLDQPAAPILMSASLSSGTITSLLRPLRSKTFCQRRIVTSFYVWITHPSKRNDNHIENGELQSLWKCHYSWWICTCELTRCCAN